MAKGGRGALKRLLDLRALAGDASDNIPGVAGIGPKGAAELIRRWGDLENLLAHAAEVPGKRAREALIQQAEQARLSKCLATLRTDVPLPLGLEAAARREPDLPRLRALFERLGFSRLLEGLAGEAEPGLPGAGAPEVRRIDAPGDLDALVAELRALPGITLAGVFGDAPPMSSDPAGLAFALGPEQAAYVPLAGEGLLATGLPPAEVVARAAWSFEGARARRGPRARPRRSRSGSRSRASKCPRRPSTASWRSGCSIPAARERSRRSHRSSSGSPCAPGKSWPAAAPRRARRARSRSTRWRPGPRRRRAPRVAWRSRSPASS
jgi:hypothetical protein